MQDTQDKYWQADIKFSPRDFALYEAIIVRKNKTVPATKRIDIAGLSDERIISFPEYGKVGVSKMSVNPAMTTSSGMPPVDPKELV